MLGDRGEFVDRTGSAKRSRKVCIAPINRCEGRSPSSGEVAAMRAGEQPIADLAHDPG